MEKLTEEQIEAITDALNHNRADVGIIQFGRSGTYEQLGDDAVAAILRNIGQ